MTRDRTSLRDRLIEARRDLLDALDRADAIEPGWLIQLAGIAAALKAIEAERADHPIEMLAALHRAEANRLRAAGAARCAAVLMAALEAWLAEVQR